MSLLEKILARCEEVGECLEWTGHVGNGVPQVYVAGKYLMVRRLVWSETARQPIPSGRSPVMKCRSKCCVRFDHIRLMTPKQVGALAAKEGKFSTPARRIAITNGMRKREGAKLDEAKVAAILAAPSGKAAAAEHGIHRSMACRIRSGKAWRTVVTGASVFQQV